MVIIKDTNFFKWEFRLITMETFNFPAINAGKHARKQFKALKGGKTNLSAFHAPFERREYFFAKQRACGQNKGTAHVSWEWKKFQDFSHFCNDLHKINSKQDSTM